MNEATGQRQSRYGALSEGIGFITTSINGIEIMADEIAGSVPCPPSTNLKSAPEPNNIAFLIESLPGLMKQCAVRIEEVEKRLRNAFI